MTRLDRFPRGPQLVLLAFLMGACAAPSLPVSRPSPTPLPARQPSADLQEVLVDGLAVGDAPPGADPLEAAPATLHRGELVWILDTAEVDGEPLVLVVADREVAELETPFGWIPATRGGEPSLGNPAVVCPAEPLRATDILALGRFGGLACFGDDAVELIAFAPLACGIGGSPRNGTPDWLNGTWSSVAMGDAVPQPDVQLPTISVRVAPPGDLGSDCGLPARHRFTAHFDDPASATCRTTEGTDAGLVVLDERLSELRCRTQLVVTDAAPLADG